MAENVTIRFNADGIRRTLRRMDSVRDRLDRMGISGDRLRSAFRGVRRAALGVVAGLGAAGVALGAIAKSAVDAGSALEQAGIRLDSIFGSMEEGQAALKGLIGAAKQLPFTFREIVDVAPTLAVVSDNAAQLRTRLFQAAEISARFGTTMRETAGNMVRFFSAGAAAADLFRERGVLQALGVVQGEETTLEESKRLWRNFFIDIEESGTSAIGRLADSFEGRLSMLQDAWFRLMASIAESGVMDAVKAALTEVRDLMQEFMDSGRARQFAMVFTRALSAVVSGIQVMLNVFVEFARRFRETYSFLPGISAPASVNLARADERLDRLLQLRTEVRGGAALANLRPRAAAFGVTTDRDAPAFAQRAELEQRLTEAIERQRQAIDAPGGLSDQFDANNSLMASLNETLSGVIRALEGGGAGASGVSAPSVVGAAGGAGGLSISGPLDLSAVGGFIGSRLNLEKIKNVGEITSETMDTMVQDALRAQQASEQAFVRIGDVAITAMGQAVTAAVSGFDNIGSIIINTVTQILQSLSRGPGGGILGSAFGAASFFAGPFAPLVGAAGGILGAIIGGGRDRPQPVEIKNRDPIAVEEQQDRGPLFVVSRIIAPDTGEVIDEFINEARRRERRDAVSRIPPGASFARFG